MEYSSCLNRLSPWFAQIISCVKKDLKAEHLSKDIAFCKKMFPGKRPMSLSTEDLVEAYEKVFTETTKISEELGQFIASRWVLKHTDLYDLFFSVLSKISAETESIKAIPAEVSSELIRNALENFSAIDVYLFSELNFVVFSEEEMAFLRQKALDQLEKDRSIKETLIEIKTQDGRFEKKFLGLQKKYLADTTALKKQIASLQRKVQELQGASK